jgi:hypothetical protein
MSGAHPALLLCSSCVPEKLGIKQKLYSHQKDAVGVRECCQPKGIKLKMRKHTVRSDENGQQPLQQKGIKQMSTKQGLGVFLFTINNVLIHYNKYMKH